MSDFPESRWANREFSADYRDQADLYIPFRHPVIDIVKSFYGHFVDGNAAPKVLDLGCGDGLFVQELLKSFSPSRVVLVDGSADMLKAARGRLGDHAGLNFVQTSFQDLVTGDGLGEGFDFVHSSLAIHHLSFVEKKRLYTYVYDHLRPGGAFVQYDVVVPPFPQLEAWYLSLWKMWIKGCASGDCCEELLHVPEQYRGNPDNTPDTLEALLEVLESVGFLNVDCYFKYGIFGLFGGQRA